MNRIPLLLATALMTACLVAAQPQGARNEFASLPKEVVAGRPFTVVVGYALPAGMAETTLHCEVKWTGGPEVLLSDVATVRGAGRHEFTMTAPTDVREIIVAAWLGEVWYESLAPIVFSPPIRVISQETAAMRETQRREAPLILAGVGHQRVPGRNVAILRDALPGLATRLPDAYAESLSDRGLRITMLDGEQIANPYVLSTDNFDLLLLTNAIVFPAGAVDALTAFVQAGGDLICLGAPAFSRLVTRTDGQWVDQAGLQDLLAQVEPQHMLFDFETGDLTAARRESNNLQSPTTYELGPSEGHGRVLHALISSLTGWDTLTLPVPEGAFPPGDTLTCFWAKGGPRTTQLVVEWRERDQSRWMATISLTPEWKHYCLRPGDFRYWQDNPSQGRGGAGDRFDPANAALLSIGLAQTHSAVAPGLHEFWVDEIGSAPDPLPQTLIGEVTPPTLDCISPALKLYDITLPARLEVDPRQAIVSANGLPQPDAPLSCHVRPQGTGYGKQRKWRWVPLLRAVAPNGEVRGTPAVLVINNADPLKGSIWASFSIPDPAFFEDPRVTGLVADLAARMCDGAFLYEGGATKYAYFRGESVPYGAQVANLGADPSGELQVRTRLAGDDGVFADDTSELQAPAGTLTSVEAGADPGNRDSCRVLVELLRNGKVIDRLEHEVNFWQPKANPVFMTYRDGDFYLGNRKWYAHGVNYMPSSGIGTEDTAYFERWLDPQPYDPEVIDRDLALCKAMGMNMVSVFCYHESIASGNLLDLLMRCEKYGLMVNLSLRPGDPLDFKWPEIGEIIQAFRLQQNDTVSAYDIAWEPMWGYYDRRTRWDPEWEQWVVERYGSLENAEADWGVPVPRADGKVTGPSDQQVREDGKWRVMVAAYRRFLDDLLSQKYGRAARLVRSVDPNHLISYRMTISGDPTVDPAIMPYDFRGVARSMDLMCPEGYGRIGDWERVKPGMFTVDYARYAAPGKPVMWAEFGYTVWDESRMGQDPDKLRFQANFYRDFFRMAQESRSNGTVCWWFPGGYRVNERSDFGVINPDGTFRDTSRVIQEWAPRLTVPRAIPEPDYWITIDRDAHCAGLQGVYRQVQEEYWRARGEGKVVGLRTEGTGTTSTNCALLAVGNTPYNGKNPPKYLNAEFDSVQVQDAKGEWVEVTDDGAEVAVRRGQPVMARARIGNTGEAAWAAAEGTGAVALSARQPSEVTFRAPIAADVPYLGTAEIGPFRLSDGLQQPATVVFEMTALDRAWFGERLMVRLRPE